MFASLIPGLRARRDPQQQQQPPLSSPASPALTTTTTTAVPSASSTAPPSIAASLPSISPPSTTSTSLSPRLPPPSTATTSRTSLTSRTTTTTPLPPTTTPLATSQARAAIVASIANLFDRDLSSRAAALHANAAAIEKQERDVARALAALRRDNDGLQRLATEHSRKVLEIGNVQNWAEMLERDFQVVEETLRLVREGSGSGSGSEGGSCGSGCDCGWGEEGGEEEEGEGAMDGMNGGVRVEGTGKGKEVDGDGMEGVVMNGVVAPEMVPIPESPRLEGVE